MWAAVSTPSPYHPHTQGPAQRDERVHNRGGLLLNGCGLDELTVYLDGTDGHGVQINERAIAGAEVVYGELNA